MLKKVFEFDNYKEFIRYWVKSQAKQGRGQYRRMAVHIRIHTTLMSHILSGKQDFSEDQIEGLGEYMGLGDSECEYFIELLRYNRAATPRLRERLSRRLEKLRLQSQEIKSRIPSHRELSATDSARFYSSWFYSALRLLTDIPEFQTREALSHALDIPQTKVQAAILFLMETGLIREQNGQFEMGPARTHLPASSPQVWTLHRNWRIKAMERHGKELASELFYTAPMSISKKDAATIRELILELISDLTRIASQSKPELLVALNLDWIQPILAKPQES